MESHKLQNKVVDSQPLVLLRDLCAQQTSGQLVVMNNSIYWFIDLEFGKITYITNSLEPLERLYNHLRGKGISLNDEIRTQLSRSFSKNAPSTKPLDGAVLAWLSRQQKMSFLQMTQTVEDITKEVFESLSWLDHGMCSFISSEKLSEKVYSVCKFELSALDEYTKQRLAAWQALEIDFWSPYQRLYYFNQGANQQENLPELPANFRALLRGQSLRQIAILINRNELDLARSLVPYIRGQIIHVREPQSPFHQLPKAPKLSIQAIELIAEEVATYTITCVDDSPTITNEISRCLGDSKYKVTAINDPVKALMQIIRIKPDLILLDVGMPMIDGYELCRLLRKNPSFKKTPIVMVTGHTGFFDRARASLVGSSDYLTKPFTKEGLLKVVNHHLDV
jgi:two-component system, chemotaxis family, response regulator PixG